MTWWSNHSSTRTSLEIHAAIHFDGVESTSMTDSAGRTFWNADITMTPTASLGRDVASITAPYEDAPLDLTFVVSCYNEAAYIVDTLNMLCEAGREVGLSFEVIVIDDCSQDRSREVVREYIASHPDDNILLRANKRNKGFAQNYVDGAFIGRGKYYRLIPGDFGEPKESIVAVLRAIGEADCIVPYYVPNHGRSITRRVLSSVYTFLINTISGNRIHYYNGVPVLLRHSVMRWHTNTKGFGFQAEILCILLDLGFSYKQMPITTFEKRQGKSNALTIPNILSVLHTIVEIASRRASKFVYASRSAAPVIPPIQAHSSELP
jgi:cellulose synthase/poly-beta-1,6-N-acetylglucosamine synthase-like glycosyltransferase